MKKRVDPKTGHNDLEFMKHPDSWPNWPLLPIKHYAPAEHQQDLAVVLVVGNGKYAIAKDANLFQLADDLATGTPRNIQWEATTPEALVADGWVVD
jgi:hypothetical protein